MLTNRSESVAWVEPQFAHLENFSQELLSYHRNPCSFSVFYCPFMVLCLSTFSEEVEKLRSSRVEEGRKPHVPNSRFWTSHPRRSTFSFSSKRIFIGSFAWQEWFAFEIPRYSRLTLNIYLFWDTQNKTVILNKYKDTLPSDITLQLIIWIPNERV